MPLDVKSRDGYTKTKNQLKHAPKMTATNTSNPQLHAKGKGYVFIKEAGLRFECPNVTGWKNPKNNFFVIRVPYVADPAKRHPQFKVRGRQENPQLWDQEMEIDFRSKAGVKVFSEFNWDVTEPDIGPGVTGQRHRYSSQSVVIPPFDIPDWWNIYVTTDPGRRACWASLIVAVDELGTWFVVDSLVQTGLHYEDAKKILSGMLNGRLPEEHIIDPSAGNQLVTTRETLIELMARDPFPMECYPAPKRPSDYAMIERYRARMRPRREGHFGIYWFANNAEAVRQHRSCVYTSQTDGSGSEKMRDADIDSVDAGKYLACYEQESSMAKPKPRRDMDRQEIGMARVSRRINQFEQARAKAEEAREQGAWSHIDGIL